MHSDSITPPEIKFCIRYWDTLAFRATCNSLLIIRDKFTMASTTIKALLLMLFVIFNKQ